jgi:hypothetical protein
MQEDNKDNRFWKGQNIFVALLGGGVVVIPEHHIWGSVLIFLGALGFIHSVWEKPMKIRSAIWLGALLLTWVAIGYDYYDRHASSETVKQQHEAWFLTPAALILLLICLAACLVMLYLERIKQRRLGESHQIEVAQIASRHSEELEAVRSEAEKKFADRDESWRRWYQQQCEWSGTFMEKAGKATVLADEARLLWQMIDKAVSEARMLGDENAAKVLQHPLDPSPIQAIADSGPCPWYLRSLNRFQSAYNEHQARIGSFPPSKNIPLCQFPSSDAAKMTADFVIIMISEHEKALLASASELRERYTDVISATSSAPASLVFDGCRPWKSTYAFPVPLGVQNLTVIYVRNNQLASADAVYNVRARIDYLRNNRPAFSIDAAVWWEEHREHGLRKLTRVDLEANECQCFAVFMEQTFRFKSALHYTAISPF